MVNCSCQSNNTFIFDEEGELGSDESEGKDWDELEKEAQHGTQLVN